MTIHTQLPFFFTYNAATRYGLAGLLLVLVGLLPTRVHAQHPIKANTQKLFLNVHALGAQSTLDLAGFQAEQGRGGGAKIGYGFSRAVTLYFGVEAAVNESINVPGYRTGQGYVDLGIQFNLTSGRNALVPYLDLAATGRSALLEAPDGTVTLTGLGGSMGGGLKLFVTSTVALDVSARLTASTFSQVDIDGRQADLGDVFGLSDIGSTAVGVSVGLTVNPFR